MRLALACAGRRGYRFLRRLMELAPQTQLTVFSFREEPHEPAFLDDIRAAALGHGGSFIETRKVDGPRAQPFWEQEGADLMLVVGWRYLIAQAVYERPRLGTYVVHDSLLPRYRGFSPTVWALANGEDHTGATLFAIAPEVDAGDIVAQQRVAIGPDETIAEVVEKVTQAYLELLERHLPALLLGTAARRPQDHSAATYMPRRGENDYRIDWTRPADQIRNLVRATTAPYPGAFTSYAGRRLRVWSAGSPELVLTGAAGAVVDLRPGRGALVGTGAGALWLGEVQWDGEARTPAAQALAGVTQPLGLAA